jgi:hypothetical protein
MPKWKRSIITAKKATKAMHEIARHYYRYYVLMAAALFQWLLCRARWAYLSSVFDHDAYSNYSFWNCSSDLTPCAIMLKNKPHATPKKENSQ